MTIANLILCLAVCASVAAADDVPPGIPSPLGPDGKIIPAPFYTTKAYEDEALRVMISEANRVGKALELSEHFPIKKEDLTAHFVIPWGYAYIKKGLGTVTSKNFEYCVSHDYKLCFILGTRQNEECLSYQELYQFPMSKMDTNQAYQMAIGWLKALSVDVDGLNRDCSVVVQLDHDYYRKVADGKFVPIYDVLWPRKGNPVSAVSVRLFTPTKELMQLCVNETKYIVTPQLAVPNLGYLLSQTNGPGGPDAYWRVPHTNTVFNTNSADEEKVASPL